MPDNYWMYYRDNKWSRFVPDNFQPYRYSMGYRGIPENNNGAVYYDEYGRQFRRDYSPLRTALRNTIGRGAPAAAGTQVDVNSGGTANGTSPNVGVEIGGAAHGNNR
jgi:hypothetical protein